MAEQALINASTIVGVGLLGVIAAFIAYVWPSVKQKVDRDRDEKFNLLGEWIASEFKKMIVSTPELFTGQPSEQSWQAIAEFYSRTFKQYFYRSPEIWSVERPMSMVREAVFVLILAAFLFLSVTGIAFTAYEGWTSLICFFAGVAVAYFLYKVALLWHDLSR